MLPGTVKGAETNMRPLTAPADAARNLACDAGYGAVGYGCHKPR